MHVHFSFPKEAQCRDGQISDVAITNCVKVCHLGHKHFFRVDTKDWKRIGIEKTANHDCDISCVIPGTKGPAGNSVTHAPQNLGWYRPLMLLTLLPPEKVADRFSLTHHGCLQGRWHNHDYFDVGLWCSGNWTGICFNGNKFDYYLPKFRRNLQVCSFVGLSVCLSVSLSSITHERFDISSPNLVHTWNGQQFQYVTLTNK